MFVSACVVSVRVIKTADFQKLRAHYFEYMKADNKNNMMSTVRQRNGIHEISVVADTPPPKRASRVIQTSKSEGHSQVRTKSGRPNKTSRTPQRRLCSLSKANSQHTFEIFAAKKQIV